MPNANPTPSVLGHQPPWPARSTPRPGVPRAQAEVPALAGPNRLVRYAFYLSLFAIPYAQLYVPGTGERIGVARLVQLLILGAVLAQPRICLRLVPLPLLWFVAYCGFRLLMGWWLAPGLAAEWWPATRLWLDLLLPWFWVMFNVMRFPRTAQAGLWALVWGCSLCALLHLAGIGTSSFGPQGLERSTLFGDNANRIGLNYSTALIALAGLGMLKAVKPSHRLLVVPLIAVLGAGIAKTGSRTAALLVILGIGLLAFQVRSFVPALRRYVMLLLVGVVLAAIASQVPTVLKRLALVQAADTRQDEPRLHMIPVLWELFLRSPIYGSGPDQYQFELTRRAMPHLIQQRQTISAHNLALRLLVETGIIGFLLFACGVGSALAAAWRARSGPGGLLPLAVLLPLLLASLTVGDLSSAPIFWFALAYSLSSRPAASSDQPYSP